MGSLWVTTPGGLRVATDEIFALIEGVVRVERVVDETAGVLAALQRGYHEHHLSQAADDARHWVEWATWFRGALDRYCEHSALAERYRTALWDTPRDQALWGLVSWTTKETTAGRGAAGAVVDDVAATWWEMAGWDTPEVSVEQVSRRSEISGPQSLAERISRIPDTTTPIRIDTFWHSDGSRHVEVFVAGTESWSLGSTDDAFDMRSNIGLVAGLTSASLLATTQAMSQAGVRPSDRVVFVGHSQGGVIAHALAESGKYRTAGLVAVGAPTGSISVRGDYPALLVEHSDDVVPRLAGARQTTNAIIVRTDSGATAADFSGAHSKTAYIDTATRIDRSASELLSGFSGRLPVSLRGQSETFAAKQF